MLTAEQHKALRERIDAENAFIDSKRGKNGWACIPANEYSENVKVENANKSAVEVYEFVNDPPERYTVYINTLERTATTWMGDVLGTVILGSEYRSNFGDKRQHVWMKGINGKIYTGTYYKSAGDYAHIRVTKKG